MLKNYINFSTLKMKTVRVLSGVASLAIKSQFSVPCSFRDMKFYDFFNIFKKFTLEKNHKF